MIHFQLEKPRLERYFIRMLKRKPQFLFTDQTQNRAFRLQVFLEMHESYEKLGMLICNEFLEEKTLIKYADMLVRDLETLADYDHRIYINYLHYTKAFLEDMIDTCELEDEFETAFNFSKVLVLFLKKYQN